MKHFFSLLGVFLITYSLAYSQSKEVKVDDIVYTIDFNKGSAAVAQVYRTTLLGDIKEPRKKDIVLPFSIPFRNKIYLVTSISDYAFKNCNNICSIKIPGTINEIGSKVFENLRNLKQIEVSPDNQYFQSINGVLFNKDMSVLLRFPPKLDLSFYCIPSTVVAIGESAFKECQIINSISIPNSVKYIEANAFYDCYFISITIPNSVIEIGDNAFSLCYFLKTMELPPSISKLGEKAFSYCPNLNSFIYQNKELYFPSNVFDHSDKMSTANIQYQVPQNLFLELAQKGNPEDQYNLATCYLNGEGFHKDEKIAKDWLMKAAKQGHLLSQKILGDLYLNGIGTTKNYHEAIYWYSLAAKAGNASAQAAMARCYFHGTGVKQDYYKAINLYKLAANQGDELSQGILGACYYFGKGGCKINMEEAVKWFKLSADKGNMESAFYLAKCYYEGQGVIQNKDEAFKWIEMAVNGGIEEGQKLYCILAYEDAVKNINSQYYSAAITRFTSVLKYDSLNIDCYINRGYCYLNLPNKDYASAEADFKEALELDRNNQIAKNNLQFVKDYYQRINEAKSFSDQGDKYYDQKDYVNAVSSYAKSLSLDNTNPYPYYSIGYCYFSCQQYNEAITYFDKAIALNPNYTDAIKARKNTKIIIITNAISQVATAVANSLDNAYNNSINNSDPSSSAEVNTSTSNSSTSRYDAYNKYQTDKFVNEEKKHQKNQYEMYMRLYRQEKSEADNYYREYDIHKDASDLSKSKDCEARATRYLEQANIWK